MCKYKYSSVFIEKGKGTRNSYFVRNLKRLPNWFTMKEWWYLNNLLFHYKWNMYHILCLNILTFMQIISAYSAMWYLTLLRKFFITVLLWQRDCSYFCLHLLPCLSKNSRYLLKIKISKLHLYIFHIQSVCMVVLWYNNLFCA